MFPLFAVEAANPSQPLTLLELIQSGGWVMIPLLICSLIAVSLIVYYFLTFKRSTIYSDELLPKIDSFLDNGDFQGLLGYVQGRPDAVSGIITQTLLFLKQHPRADATALQAVAESEGNRIAAALHQKSVYLMDLGALAPMLGLFGTVVGILRSFGSIALEASPMRTMLLAGGVSQALVATAAGLVIGISSMFFYSYFRGRVQGLISDLETQTSLALQPILLLKKSK
ncbi:MAG: MotA/TolQ/ExbB proton channel family protein [Verrucomicrobiota bacterium]